MSLEAFAWGTSAARVGATRVGEPVKNIRFILLYATHVEVSRCPKVAEEREDFQSDGGLVETRTGGGQTREMFFWWTSGCTCFAYNKSQKSTHLINNSKQ